MPPRFLAPPTHRLRAVVNERLDEIVLAATSTIVENVVSRVVERLMTKELRPIRDVTKFHSAMLIVTMESLGIAIPSREAEEDEEDEAQR